jgi:hypothetical protein
MAHSKAAPALDMEGGSLDGLRECANTLDRRLAGLSPLCKSNAKRGSPTTSRPKRVGQFGSDSETSRLHEVNQLAILQLPPGDSAPINSQCNSYLSRDFPITMTRPC